MRYNTSIDFIQASGGNVLDVHHAEFEPSIPRGGCVAPTLAEMWVIDDATGDNTDETLESTITTCIGDGVLDAICGTIIDPSPGSADATICRMEFPNLSLIRAEDSIRVHSLIATPSTSLNLFPYISTSGVNTDTVISKAITSSKPIGVWDIILTQAFIDDLFDQGSTVEDFYPFSDASEQNGIQAAGNTSIAQSFTGAGGVLTRVRFSLARTGSPPGVCRAKLYAHQGTFGVDSTPVGEPLDVSGPIDPSTFPENPTFKVIDFSFAGQVTLVNGTNYVIAIEYDDGDFSNRIDIELDETPTNHAGNYASINPPAAWLANSAGDLVFEIITGGTDVFAIRLKVGGGAGLSMNLTEVEGCFFYSLDPTGFTTPSGTLYYEPEEEQIERLTCRGSSGVLQIRDVEGIGYYESTTLQEIAPGPYTIQWDRALVDDGGFTFLSSDSESIILPIDGLYKLTYHVNFMNNSAGGASDASMQAQLRHNGSGILGSIMSAYVPTIANGRDTNISCYFMAIARAGDEIQLEVDFTGGTSLIAIDVEDAYLEVEFIRRGERRVATEGGLEARF